MAFYRTDAPIRPIWEGIALRITWSPRWLEYPDLDLAVAHLTVESEDRTPLPFTQTGFQSRFLSREDVERYGGPVDYVLAWLAHEADKPAWRQVIREQEKRRDEERQLSLF